MRNVRLFCRRFITGIASVSLVVLLASCGGSSNPYSPPGGQQPGTVPPNTTIVNIPMGSMGMGPAAFGVNPLVVKVGATVTWVNQDTLPHSSTSDTGGWDSGTIASGQNFSHQFTTAGTFPYHCSIHGAASMSGVVQVNP